LAGFDLTGKKAFVTGASRGIGRAISVAFAEAGADVALVARDPDTLAETAREVDKHGRESVSLPCDVTDRQQLDAAVAEAAERLGGLDVVVNNAGGQRFMVPFLDTRLDGWEKVLRLNLDSAMWVCRAAGPHLTGGDGGSVINVASVAGLAASPLLAPYGAAKAALINLTKSLAIEWAGNGVRVNALCPGWTATDLNRNLWSDPQATATTLAGVPMQRWGKPEEMAAPAVFLASDAASYMTGQVLVVDGGQSVTP
jgi:NAD(P)-dependent dehydrogenase (short-subunit alcohol dehydrogenase family)